MGTQNSNTLNNFLSVAVLMAARTVVVTLRSIVAHDSTGWSSDSHDVLPGLSYNQYEDVVGRISCSYYQHESRVARQRERRYNPSTVAAYRMLASSHRLADWRAQCVMALVGQLVHRLGDGWMVAVRDERTKVLDLDGGLDAWTVADYIESWGGEKYDGERITVGVDGRQDAGDGTCWQEMGLTPLVGIDGPVYRTIAVSGAPKGQNGYRPSVKQ